MKVRYLGHASFELVSKGGSRIIFDPYEAGAYDGALQYGPITGEYDIAVVSHDHADHSDPGVMEKVANLVDGAGTFDFEGVRVISRPTYHDESGGSERGKNLVSIVELDGLRVAHLGDLGHALDAGELEALGSIDLLLVPVGGHFTIDATTAAGLVGEIDPRIVVPMHFKTDKVGFPIAPVEEFTGLMEEVEVAGGSEFDIEKGDLPERTKVVVLEPAL